jgi:hypothetical protein
MPKKRIIDREAAAIEADLRKRGIKIEDATKPLKAMMGNLGGVIQQMGNDSLAAKWEPPYAVLVEDEEGTTAEWVIGIRVHGREHNDPEKETLSLDAVERRAPVRQFGNQVSIRLRSKDAHETTQKWFVGRRPKSDPNNPLLVMPVGPIPEQ